MAKLKSENCNLQAVSFVLLSFLLIMPGVIDLESIYFSGLDDNTLFSSSDDYLEKPLCVPQDPVEELEWYPNFSDDLISVSELESEFNSENKLMFLDKAEKKNKKTMENFASGTTESSGKLAGRISFSENRNQVLCPNLNHENKFEFLKTEKSSGKYSGQKPLETEKSSEKSDVGNLFSETEKSLEKSENQNKIFTSQSIIKNEPVRVSYPNFGEFMTMDKFKLLKASEEKKTTIKHLPLKTKKSSGKSPVRKPNSEKSPGKLPLPLQIPDKSLEHPSLRKPFSENTNKLFLSQTNTQSKQTLVLYHENRSGIESESTRLENTLFVNYPKSVRSKTRRLRRHEHLQKFSTEQPKRKCSHCETEKTPQWRNGPLGPKTLCNACGVRYKSGRLLPDYRPAASPTFDAKKHSNYHKRILKKKGLKNF